LISNEGRHCCATQRFFLLSVIITEEDIEELTLDSIKTR